MAAKPGAAGREGFAELALMVRGFQLSKMLQVAAALEIADHVSDGPRPVAQLAAAAGADAAILLRLCRALAAFGVFTVSARGEVGQSVASTWLRKDAKPTLHYAARYWTTPGNWRSWANLEDAVRSGRSPFEPTLGARNFDYLAAHPDEAVLFDLFMQHSPDDRHAAVVAAYDFSQAGLVVDVGGGNGALIAAILGANPRVGGLLYDQEAVVAGASQMFADRGIAARCRIEAGDFFARVPGGGNVYTLSQILHDWDDARCGDILARCRSAMGPDARLLVIERVLEEEPGPASAIDHLADMHMLVIHGGKERTAAEFASLLERAGFAAPRLVPTHSPFKILETRPV